MIRSKLSTFAAFLALGFLILDSAHAVQWAAEGVSLCVRTVLPSLFPFFVVSSYLTGNLGSVRLLRPIAGLFRVSGNSLPGLLCGFLGGYPVGAAATRQLWSQGAISSQEARRMLAFCSQAGPSFLFGILAGKFSHPAAPWILWSIQWISAWMVSSTLSPAPEHSAEEKSTQVTTLAEAMRKALHSIAGVCGWVIIFRVILGFCQRWIFWYFPEPIQILLSGLLELTNGCCMLGNIPDEHLRFLICSMLLNFGGLCVFMQTVHAAAELGISNYCKGKLLQTLFALLITSVICGFLPVWALIILILPWLKTGKRRNFSSIPAPFGV